MKKYREIYTNRIPETLGIPWVRKAIKESLPDKDCNLNLSRWSSNSFYPPIDVLTLIAETVGLSTSYLLGQTDVRCGTDIPAGKPRSIRKVIARKGLSYKEIARRAETKSERISSLIKSFPNIRTNSFIALSEAIGVSTDYLLGLTDKETWDELRSIEDIEPGYPAYMESLLSEDDGETCDGMYILISQSGDTVFFSDGTVRKIGDEFFNGRSVFPVMLDRKQV